MKSNIILKKIFKIILKKNKYSNGLIIVKKKLEELKIY